MAMRDTLKHFRYYLLGAQVVMRTDHKPLLKILEQKDPFGRRATLMRDIAEFEPRIEFIRGQDNHMADALSRIGWNVKWEERDEDTSKVATIGGSQDEIGPCKDVRLDINDFQVQQERDPTLKPHISTHRNEHGLFTRDHKKQVLLPASLVPTILSLAHDETGHQGADKMLARIEPHYWWPKMKAEVENYAKTCQRCAATLAQGHRKAPIHQRPKEEKPFALIEVDLKGPLPRTKEGFDNIVVITDPCTKYAEMHPIRGQTSQVVCKTLMGWISRYGLPNKVHSDNGPCFISETFEQFCITQGIEHTFSPPYRPQGNAGVERINRTMGEALTKLVDKHPNRWSQHLPDVQLAYNTAVHTSTGVSPYELVFKEHPRSKFEIITEKISPATVREKTERLRETVSEVFQKAQESDAKLAEKRRERYNSKTSFKSLGVGQQVWKRNLRAKTFADRWTGPYVVIKPTSVTKTSYVVRRNNGTKEEIVHYNYLKPYQIRPVKKPKSRNPPKKNGVGHPALGTSEDSESDSRQEETQPERRYPERIRRPPEKYT
ncbi:Transposon Ty3-G Gag-Pol poly [Paramuricea clavata]|uniref:Transposon Ty3-G Gag-Pol poly n=1 Tax=Paramuricea clavata TaxID=317549 RepID=A0A6S7GZU4_PARCT|nr:Transposon Ty3-G Gag-Pol poly [Paramuricea clavata]